MPVQISVGPPVITINQGNTFMVTDLNGEISPESEQGVFSSDTRFISKYKVYANGQPWVRLSSSASTYYSALVYLTNQALPVEDGTIPASTIGLTISRAIGDGLHEDLDVTNYSLKPIKFNLEMEVRSDFADLFEVKDHKITHRGRIHSTRDRTRQEERTTYANRDFVRTLVFHVLKSDSPPRLVNGLITFEISLGPGESWHACYHLNLETGQQRPRLMYQCYFERGETELDRLQADWQDRTTKLTSSNVDLERAFRQSVEDMGALRLYDYDYAPDVWLPAAGVPWFVTVFGRDSLIVSLQNVLVDPGFTRAALKTLAKYQATEMDDYRDAEPGKILHELRFGELAHFKKIPHTPYYGTWDATPFYLIALNSAWRWQGDDQLLHEYKDNALRCLDWIDKYGDIDGDGFQEYKTRSPLGYENVGWKDAGDAVVYPDGSQVKQPKALCELQGYVFDAWLRTADLFDHLGETDRAAHLRRKAADLQKRFEEAFWMEDLGFYAYGLDPEKKQIKTIASNPGHLLMTGIVSPERAARVVKRLMEPDMWTGWGIRTLSSQNPAYNPFSYQNGSVWPHDNGITALGFKRYGFSEEASRIAHDVVLAASYFVSYRLPELYAGIERRPGNFPVQYLGANVPQAWAAGSIFLFVQLMLGLRADAPHNTVYVDPWLPDWVPDLTLKGLRVGEGKVDLRFWREGERTRWEVLNQEGELEVKQEPFGGGQVQLPRAA